MKIPPQPPWQPTGPRIAFIGDAPDLDDIHEGLPLAGSPGRLMGQLLRTAGMTRTDEIDPKFYPNYARRGLRPLLWERSNFFWTNVFSEALPGGEVKALCAPAPEAKLWPDYTLERIDNAGYLRPEHQHHLVRLADELRRFNPDLIIPLGGTALWAFTGTSNISENRGAVAKARYVCPGVKLLPTLHPAHVQVAYKMFSVVTADLLKAQREAQFPEIRLPKRELWIEPTIADLWAFKKKHIDNTEIIAVDIETAVKAITCIGFGTDNGRCITIPFVDYRKPNRSYWLTEDQEFQAWEFVREICEGPKPKLMQNGSYDCYYIWRANRIKINNYLHDTRLMHHALFPELPKSLSFMGAAYTDNTAWKIMRKTKQDDGRDK